MGMLELDLNLPGADTPQDRHQGRELHPPVHLEVGRLKMPDRPDGTGHHMLFFVDIQLHIARTGPKRLAQGGGQGLRFWKQGTDQNISRGPPATIDKAGQRCPRWCGRETGERCGRKAGRHEGHQATRKVQDAHAPPSKAQFHRTKGGNWEVE
jgi:hypothetical protein